MVPRPLEGGDVSEPERCEPMAPTEAEAFVIGTKGLLALLAAANEKVRKLEDRLSDIQSDNDTARYWMEQVGEMEKKFDLAERRLAEWESAFNSCMTTGRQGKPLSPMFFGQKMKRLGREILARTSKEGT